MKHRLCPAGVRVDAWLRKSGKSRTWLADQLKVDRVVLWRWLMGLQTPRVDFAVELQRITGASAGLWRQTKEPRNGTDG